MSDSSLHKQKKIVRKRLLERRNQLDRQTYLEKSRLIISSLRKQPEFQKAQTVHCFVSMNDRNEVNTHELIQQMLGESKTVVVPRMQWESKSMEHIQLKKFAVLKKNEWGIMEPEEGEKVDLHQIDLVIVPMAGGDQNCNRIGYGGGFYDRFLSSVPEIPHIGVTFDCCMVENRLPVNEHDVRLAKIITESKIIES